ncbi:MAG: GH92 family glycosyl hydrolase, partial [Prevotella sp.]|nr:GH92 family glycosyl hydrolase [Prevotella sp.]
MKKISLFLLGMLLALVSCSKSLTEYVDPMIGTGGHGHVFLGANVPFGFVQLGPTEPTRGWDWCSGYHYSDSVLVGFSHTHLSGTGCGDLGDVRILPISDIKQRDVLFSHKDEQCRPGYYSLLLNYPEGGTCQAELTATLRTGFHRYVFSPDVKTPYLLIDLEWGTGWDKVTECKIAQTSARKIEGLRHSEGWANNQKLFFVAEFSEDVNLQKLQDDSLSVISWTNRSRPLMVKVGLSAVSIKNAWENLQQENSGWNFNQVAKDANAAWEKELKKIKIYTRDEEQKKVFYTSLYHTMVAPSVFNDVNGDYRGSDGEVHHGDFTNYTTFSLWDTYRAWHPLSSLIHPDRQSDIAETMLRIYKEQGKLPVWHLMGCETNCMVGNPAIPVLADMMMKGFKVDRPLAIEAMKESVGSHPDAHEMLVNFGYVPFGEVSGEESIGKGMEYAIAYGAAYRATGDEYFKPLADSYKHYFDAKTGFMRARDVNGVWHVPFDPYAPELNKIKDYTEGNAWQYIWLVPHDVPGLVSLFGSEENFITKLDSLFVVDSKLTGEAPPDISGLIGQYAHGNEPSHHVIYLYNYVGQPWKTAQRVREAMNTQYHANVDGICGNEDVGQMSAWYILSAMGFYQVEPAGGRYVLGSPLFDKVSMKVGAGKTFTVVAKNNSSENIYIQKAKLNGKDYPYSYIDFKDIQKGGTLELTMGNQPSKFGTEKQYRP